MLVVDDIPDNLELLVASFEDTLIDVDTAKNGQEALDKALAESFDLVLLDIRMPVMDGSQAAQAIKKARPDLPIVALTTSVIREEYHSYQNDCFDGQLRKPVLRQELFTELTRFLPYTVDSKKINDQVQELSDENKRQLPKVLDALSDQIPIYYRQAMQSKNLKHIKVFCDELTLVAQRFEMPILESYCHELREAIDAFDIADIERLMTRYVEIEQYLENV